MESPAIKVSGVWKRYRIGSREPYKTIRDSLSTALSSILHGSGRPSLRDNGESIWALKDVSFDVEPGEVVGIIGRNGAGKSTLLKVISRITHPTRGRIEFRGRIGSLLEVGTGFHPELSGHENVYLYGAVLGMDRWEVTRKFDEIIAFAELEKFVDTPVKFYSSGMYMRLAFAVAAHLEPEILLVDEVLAVGDTAFQQKCLGKMDEVSKREGRTVLFVSHHMPAIQRLCKRVILLKQGGVAAIGPTSVVTDEYLKGGAEVGLSWKRAAPPKPEAIACFHHVCFTDEQGRELGQITTSGPNRVDLEFEILKPCRNLQVSINVHDDTGSIIFASAPQDSDLTAPGVPGKYRASVELPKNLFLSRMYGLTVSAWAPLLGTIEDVNCFLFAVQESDSASNKTPERRSGLLYVPGKWQIWPETGPCAETRLS